MEVSVYILKYKDGESVELSEAKWIDASLSQPEKDVDVLVLIETELDGCYKVSVGHIVDKSKCVWNIDGVRYWFPYPELPNK